MALRADDVDLGRDRALVEQYQDGDYAAFEDLYRRYYGRLFRFCLRRTGNPHDAEELTQEAFARAFRAMPALRGERRFYPWLSVIASRLCIDSHRRLGRTEPTAEVDAGSVDGGHDRVEAAVDHELLFEAMARLNDRHREVLHLREREGWSYQHIADHYDISLSAVEGLLFRARQALRREFLAVAGPEAGLAAAAPLSLGLFGRLARRFGSAKLRASEWAAGWANMPALAANGLGLAMVVTTAGGLAGGLVGDHRPAPITVTVAAAPISAMHDEPVAEVGPVAQAVTPADASTSSAEADNPAPRDELREGAENAVTSVQFVSAPEARDRADDQPYDGTIGDKAILGVDPSEIARDVNKKSDHYVEQIKGEKP